MIDRLADLPNARRASRLMPASAVSAYCRDRPTRELGFAARARCPRSMDRFTIGYPGKVETMVDLKVEHE